MRFETAFVSAACAHLKFRFYGDFLFFRLLSIFFGTFVQLIDVISVKTYTNILFFVGNVYITS
jgi:hypothetical protein